MLFSSTLEGFAWAAAIYVFFGVLTATLKARRHTAMARELGCEEPAVEVNRLPFGIDQVLGALEATRNLCFPTFGIKRQEEVGATTFKYSILGSNGIMTSDERNIQAILATKFNDFEIGPMRRNIFFPLFGDGIFTQNGPAWSRSRSMMRPQFAREQVSDLNLEESHVQNLMRHLVAAPNADGWTDQVDLQVLFFRLTLDSATEFLFSESVNSQLVSLPSDDDSTSEANLQENGFVNAFHQAQVSIASRARFRDFNFIYNPPSFRRNCRTCHKYIDRFVELALRKTLRGEIKGTPSQGEKYVFLDALATQTQDPTEMRFQLLHVLLAGRDTTASLLGWLFFALVRDPARYTKLRGIILDEFGPYKHPKKITFEKLKNCMYLQHCMSESLRVFPILPFNSRRAIRDTTLPRGGGPDGKNPVFVPKGTPVDYSTYVMHHRKDLWGEDAEEWKPERWDGRKVGWEFLPVSPFLQDP
jgi:cytochrome P450